MRLYLKICLVLLLAARFVPAAAHVLPVKARMCLRQDTKDDLVKKPIRQHACLAEESEEAQVALHFRWPLIIPCLFGNSRVTAQTLALLPASSYLLSNHPRLAFYRSLLYPSHFFR